MDKNLIIILIVSYFIGNISPSYIVGNFFRNIDIRDYGSGNAGTTNALRVMGRRIALIVFTVDFLKGFLTVFTVRHFFSEQYAMMAAVAVVLGHIFPLALKFRGGKGAAASIGIYMCMFPKLMLIASFICLVLLYITRFVSLSSMTLVSLMTVFVYFFSGQKELWVYFAVIMALVLFSHRSNIKKLLAGTESKLGAKR